MTRAVTIANGLGFGLALLLAALSGFRAAAPTGAEPGRSRVPSSSDFLRRDTRGTPELRDKSGVWLPLVDYRRIVSGSTIADELLLEFAEPRRIAAFTEYSQKSPNAQRYANKPHLSGLGDLERLIALEPDLLLLNTLGSETRVARLRELGIPVFDLGEMRGVDSFLADARAIATIVGRPELGEQYAASFRRRLEHVAPDVPASERKRAAYLAVFGTNVYGGGRHTSYDDVLHYAGLVNALAKSYEGWPDLSTEEVLVLDPEVIVTQRGMADALCALTELDRLSACKAHPPAIVEVDPSLLSDPGSGMLPTAERIRDGVLALSGGRP
jgi:iron complex transport system substrate-binding protein